MCPTFWLKIWLLIDSKYLRINYHCVIRQTFLLQKAVKNLGKKQDAQLPTYENRPKKLFKFGYKFAKVQNKVKKMVGKQAKDS